MDKTLEEKTNLLVKQLRLVPKTEALKILEFILRDESKGIDGRILFYTAAKQKVYSAIKKTLER